MTERKTKNRRSKAPADAIALLTQDHKAVQQLFKDFEKRKEQMDEETKAELVRKFTEFRSGAKPATVMHQISKGYTDQQIQLIAEYFSAQKK